MPFLISLFQGAAFSAIKGAAIAFFSMVGSFLGSNMVGFFFDAVIEALEWLVEQREAKARLTPEKADDRQAAIYRKWLERFKLYAAKNGKN